MTVASAPVSFLRPDKTPVLKSQPLDLGFTMSWSRFSTFMDCPACFEAQYINGQPRFTSAAMAIGSGVHRAAEVLRWAAAYQSEASVEELMEAAASGADDNLTGVGRDGEVHGEVVVDLQKYADAGEVKDAAVSAVSALGPIIAAEVHHGYRAIEAEIDFSGVFPFAMTGYADVVLAEPFTIKDLKTASRNGLPNEAAAWQLSLYALPFLLAEQPVTLGVDQVVKLVRSTETHLWTEPGFTLSTDLQQALKVRDQVIKAARMIAAGDFPASPRAAYGHNYQHDTPKFVAA